MKPNCDRCKNDPVYYNAMREICDPCIFEAEKPTRENICLKCEHLSYCSMAVHRDDGKVVMTGCSRFEEKHKQTRADKIRRMTDEELARLANKIETESCAYGIKGRAAWLEWLQKECE